MGAPTAILGTPAYPSQEAAARLRSLLAAYHETAWATVEVPPVVFPRRSGGRIGRHIRPPRPRWLLRYFVVQHIHRRLDEIERRVSALATFAEDRLEHARELDMLQDFRRSLPPRPSRRLLIVLAAIATLLIVRVLVAVGGSDKDDEAKTAVTTGLETLFVSLNPRDFLEAVETSPVIVTLKLFAGMVMCAYVVLRLAYPGFRLKRALFNIYPGGARELGSTTMREQVTAVSGLYRVEAEALRALGVRPQREFPFDLALSLVPATVWTGLGIASLGDEAVVAIIVFIVPGVLRLGWLGYVLRQRTRHARPVRS